MERFRVISTRNGQDELSDWMDEPAAIDLAEDLGGQGVYDAVRLEWRTVHTAEA